MRRNLLIAASALTLVAAPALAQTTSPGASRSVGAGTQAAGKADPLKQEDVSEIQGAAVYGSDGKKIGSVATVLMDPESKTVDRLVVGAGGLLGVGAREVVMPVDQFQWDGIKGGFKIAKTEDDMKQMPEWKAALGNGSGGSGAATGSSATGPKR